MQLGIEPERPGIELKVKLVNPPRSRIEVGIFPGVELPEVILTAETVPLELQIIPLHEHHTGVLLEYVGQNDEDFQGLVLKLVKGGIDDAKSHNAWPSKFRFTELIVAKPLDRILPLMGLRVPETVIRSIK